MAQASKHEDDLEGLVMGLLGLVLVLIVTGGAYFFISQAITPGTSLSVNRNSDLVMGWIWVGFGCGFFLYGAVGVIREKIGVGWGNVYWQVRTTLSGSSAFVAGSGTAVGGLLMLSTSAAYFYSEVSQYFSPFAALLCGFLSIFFSWAVGAILHKLGY